MSNGIRSYRISIASLNCLRQRYKLSSGSELSQGDAPALVVSLATPYLSLARELIAKSNPKDRTCCLSLSSTTFLECSTLLQNLILDDLLNGKDLTATDSSIENPEKSISRIFRRLTKLTPSTNTAKNSDNTLMRKSLMFLAPGAIEKMSIKEHNVEEPSDGQVRIAVKSASVNFLDLLKKTRNLSEKWAISSVHMSKTSSIFDKNPSCVGNRVVAVDSNAVGGVGNAVIQLAKTVPDVTIIAICSKSKHEYIKSLGVQHTIDYRTQDYVTEVKKISPKGMTNFSGAEQSIFRSFKGWFKCLSMNSLTIINTNKMVNHRLWF
ncbi:hypothetical protein GJ496_005468 [Pomphorhynchus laevis]|nr:hypothetical protein GJ496_005468 [Pomphorhynchus laevis]